jgi:hypothetical protein
VTLSISKAVTRPAVRPVADLGHARAFIHEHVAHTLEPAHAFQLGDRRPRLLP